MSFFSYFITEKPLPTHILEKIRTMHFSLSDITRYVKDARGDLCYYDFEPATIYIPSTKFTVDRSNPYNCRTTTLDEFYKWILNEFKKNGGFMYIQFREDGTKTDTGYHEAYFRKCKKEDILFPNFLVGLTSVTRALEDDILYTVVVD